MYTMVGFTVFSYMHKGKLCQIYSTALQIFLWKSMLPPTYNKTRTETTSFVEQTGKTQPCICVPYIVREQCLFPWVSALGNPLVQETFIKCLLCARLCGGLSPRAGCKVTPKPGRNVHLYSAFLSWINHFLITFLLLALPTPNTQRNIFKTSLSSVLSD